MIEQLTVKKPKKSWPSSALKHTRVYLIPFQATEVICQYDPAIVVSCIVPEASRTVVERGRSNFNKIKTPAVLWMQKATKKKNQLTQKYGDIFLHKLVERSKNGIKLDDYMPYCQNGEVCWGHSNKPDPRSMREANIRYWASGHYNQAYGNYRNNGYDANKMVFGNKYVNLCGKTEAVLISSDMEILKLFPTPMWTRLGKNPLIIYPIAEKDGEWYAKVGKQKISLGESTRYVKGE